MDGKSVERKKRAGTDVYQRRELEYKYGKRNVVDRYNSFLSGRNKGVGGKTSKSGRDYISLMESGQTFEIAFTSNIEGDFSVRDGEWEVVLTNEAMQEYNLEEGDNEKFLLLNKGVEVRVESIDFEEGRGIVYAILAGSGSIERKDRLRNEIKSVIGANLVRGLPTRVWGRVTKVLDSAAYVDIMGLGIFGTIKTAGWKESFTYSFQGIVEVGEWYEMEVISKLPKKEGKDTGYLLSRRNIGTNDWVKSGIDKLRIDTMIAVRCTVASTGDPYWVGVSESLPGVEVRGDFTEKFQMGIDIRKNITYLCKVKRIEEYTENGYVDVAMDGNHKVHERGYRVTVRPIAVSEDDREIFNRMKELPLRKRR